MWRSPLFRDSQLLLMGDQSIIAWTRAIQFRLFFSHIQLVYCLIENIYNFWIYIVSCVFHKYNYNYSLQ